ncbi:hypothetical protein ILYODFUR_021691 [Ilyodon furcidens]|uniref:Uncharacterized protein n=1 Tax=Ilyodon furcidens TaxID=33524 RepID=A0ABV0U8F1_9TELE
MHVLFRQENGFCVINEIQSLKPLKLQSIRDDIKSVDDSSLPVTLRESSNADQDVTSAQSEQLGQGGGKRFATGHHSHSAWRSEHREVRRQVSLTVSVLEASEGRAKDWVELLRKPHLHLSLPVAAITIENLTKFG